MPVSEQRRRELRAAHGADRVREAMRNENSGPPDERIEVIASRARDAEAMSQARRDRAALGALRRSMAAQGMGEAS